MKIQESKTSKLYSVGFIDPDKVHIETEQLYPKETEENLLRFLTEQNLCDHILFSYNFK